MKLFKKEQKSPKKKKGGGGLEVRTNEVTAQNVGCVTAIKPTQVENCLEGNVSMENNLPFCKIMFP